MKAERAREAEGQEARRQGGQRGEVGVREGAEGEAEVQQRLEAGQRGQHGLLDVHIQQHVGHVRRVRGEGEGEEGGGEGGEEQDEEGSDSRD